MTADGKDWTKPQDSRSQTVKFAGEMICPIDEEQELLAVARETLLSSQSCIQETERFLAQLSTRIKNPKITGLPSFIHNLEKRRKTTEQLIQDLSTAPLSKEAVQLVDHKLNTCAGQVSKSVTHWDVLKRCRSFVAVNRAFQGSDKASRNAEIAKVSNMTSREKELAHRTMKQQSKVEVHVVEGGAEWVDVRTIMPDRLARQMTDGAWGWGEHKFGDVVDEEEWRDILIAKQLKRLIAAARLNRHEYRVPRLRVVLPNIDRNTTDVNVFLDQLTRLDPSVYVVFEDRHSAFLRTHPPNIDRAIRSLVGSEFDSLTSTLNLDHTILINLVSDITHLRLEPQPWQAESTIAQIEEETSHSGLMTKEIYPILQGRRLVCTKEAAKHFHYVLSTVGTSSERERGDLLVPFKEPYKSVPHAVIRVRLQELSIYPLPDMIQMPVTIMDETWTLSSIQRNFQTLHLPAVALDVAQRSGFKKSKLSILLYGWASGNVTLSSNKEIKAHLRTLVEKYRQHNDDYGPTIWRFHVTRNLLSTSSSPRHDTLAD
ncbi:hypothetical protein QQS21_007686 [Conoideocrella luteorostrata]|uniref:DUF1308 domain-containing protein n=1 Tax=Conoideocrella luteorostrata TaxID=1105319 RepID=A0AAJ0CK83_9HYPO|nr:hypothetical protein QQS21_007686 [Conoideocrella luteorostrata]